MKRKDCNTQSPSPAERLPSLDRSSRVLSYNIYTHISSRGQHILFFKWERFRSLLSSKVYYSCRWLNEGHRVCPTIFIERQGAKQHHRVQSNMTCTSVLLWGENIVVSRMNSTLLDEDISSPLVQGTRPPPPPLPLLCVLWCLAADQSCSVQTLVTGFSRSAAQGNRLNAIFYMFAWCYKLCLYIYIHVFDYINFYI